MQVWTHQSVHAPPGPFFVRRAFSRSCWCWTSIRNSDCRSIIINIMIISLPHSVHVRTIVKEKGVSPITWTHYDTWGPNIFSFIIMYNNPRNIFLYIISFYHNFSCVYIGLDIMSIHRIQCHSYYISFMSSICPIINMSCLLTYHIISCTYHIIHCITTYIVSSIILHYNIYHNIYIISWACR